VCVCVCVMCLSRVRQSCRFPIYRAEFFMVRCCFCERGFSKDEEKIGPLDVDDETNLFCHVKCARWCNEVVNRKDRLAPSNLKKALSRRHREICSHCHKKGGMYHWSHACGRRACLSTKVFYCAGCIGCHHKKCKRTYHYPCALQAR
jgi:hypothetical protein